MPSDRSQVRGADHEGSKESGQTAGDHEAFPQCDGYREMARAVEAGGADVVS